MLRASLRSSRALACKPSASNAGRQWHAIQASRVVSAPLRGYADSTKPSIGDSKPAVLPGSASPATSQPPPPGPVATTPDAKIGASPMPATPTSSTTIPPQNVPLTPPSPSQVQATPPPSTGSTPPPPPPPPKPKRRIRRFLTGLVLLGVLGYGGGVYYSRVNDNFHDFFTEYVPFGEDAVLYFEEREFRKRFPSVTSRSRPRDTGDQVKIPSQSGVSWKVSEDNRHANATKPDAKPKEAIQTPTEKKPEEKAKAVEKAKKETGVPTPSPPPAGKSPESQPPAKPGHPVTSEPAAAKPKSSKSKSSDAVAFTAPEVDQPSKFPPEVTRIDPINIKDAKEPLVQDLVKILNDIITVVNADNSNARFSTTIGKAKTELSKVGGKIKALKDAAQKEADAQRSSDRLLCLVATAFTTITTFAAAADPVCIVGAGPAGLTIANRLQAKGLETVIFEKNPEVGGKCQAYYDELGLFHPMGALLFSNETYRETLPVIDASGLPSIPFGNGGRDTWLYEYKTGHVQHSTSSTSNMTSSSLFQAEINKYIDFWNTEFAPLASIGYKGGVKGYTMSAFDWLLENEYPLLLLLFVEGMVPYGYGDVREVPVIYMLQYLTPDILLFFAGQRAGYIIDFHQVFVTYARNQVKGPIHLSTQVTKIDRSGGYPAIIYNDPSQTAPAAQNCSKLILAFPPVMHALQAANLDISSDEQTVFEPVGIIKYWSGAIRVATPFEVVMAGFLQETFLALIDKFLNGLGLGDIISFGDFIPWLPEAAGQPVAWIRLFNTSNIATTWSWGKYRSDQTIAEAGTLLKDVISRLNKNPADTSAQPVPITDADVMDFREWDYFPHFDQVQLDQGYYDKFNALQGHQNTYYASGLNGFETVEFAIRAGKDVVDSYF